MARTAITSQQLNDHVDRLAQLYPPIRVESVDFTVKDPAAVRDRFGVMFDYLARVELEVERNVAELNLVLPDPTPEDKRFYSDVWYHQEMQHGRILDQLKVELGLPRADPLWTVGAPVRVLGLLAHIPAIQDVSRFVYYLTGASTERQAVLAYSAMIDQLGEMGEQALVDTIVHPIKRQEPGHFAFYKMSAEKLAGEIKPWQKRLAQRLRQSSYELVGTHSDPQHQAEMGLVTQVLGFDEHAEYAREIGRLEARLLWDNANGMEYPPYVLEAIDECGRLAKQRFGVSD